MSKLTEHEIQLLQIEAQNKIQKVILELELKTGFNVDKIILNNLTHMGKPIQIPTIKLKTK